MIAPLVFDLETVPTEAALAAPYPEADRNPPSNWKDPEKIAAWYDKDRVEWSQARAKECALSPRLGRIVTAGIMATDQVDATVLRATAEHEEVRLLLELWEAIAEAGGQIITFNGLTFDVPFFLVRSLIHGIGPKVPTRTVRDWTRRYSYGPHYDVRAVLTQWDSRTTGTLSEWAHALGVGIPQVTSGSDVYALYQAGDFDAIAEHCRADVVSTAQVYQAVASMFGGLEEGPFMRMAS